jgi:nucleoside-diphosphate-sugar epimerase
MSKNILLLGSNGYLGNQIKANLNQHYTIFELNRKEIQSFNFNKNEELFNGVTFHFFVNAIVEYHETTSISEIIKSNYLISFELLTVIKKSIDFKIFHFDSFYSKFYSPDTPSSYLLSKKNLVEWSKVYQFKEKHVTTFVLRLEHVIGAKESEKKFNGWLLNKLKNNECIELGPCNHSFDFVYIDDIVKAVSMLMDTKKLKNSFNYLEVGSGKSYQLKTFVNLLKSKLNSESKITFNKNIQTDLYKNQSSIANSKELMDLGWNPKSNLNEIIDLIL